MQERKSMPGNRLWRYLKRRVAAPTAPPEASARLQEALARLADLEREAPRARSQLVELARLWSGRAATAPRPRTSTNRASPAGTPADAGPSFGL